MNYKNHWQNEYPRHSKSCRIEITRKNWCEFENRTITLNSATGADLKKRKRANIYSHRRSTLRPKLVSIRSNMPGRLFCIDTLKFVCFSNGFHPCKYAAIFLLSWYNNILPKCEHLFCLCPRVLILCDVLISDRYKELSCKLFLCN